MNRPTPKRHGDREEDRRWNPSRREFLGALGGGLVIVLAPPSLPGADPEEAEKLEAWLHILPDGTVRGYTGKVEFGQGTRTGFRQVIAEELSVPLPQVRLIMGDTDLVPFDAGTYASLSTEMMRPRFQRAAARAGELLRSRAAKRWNVPLAQTALKAGAVVGPNDLSILIGALVENEALIDVLEYEPTPKPINDYELAGKPLVGVDGLERVTGAALYGTDISLPGMLHGAVLRPPFWGARLVGLDSTKAEESAGVVKVVSREDFVGVVAESERAAHRAVQLLEAKWDGQAEIDTPKTQAQLRESLEKAETVRETGDQATAWSESQIKRTAVYETSFVYHATLEPQAALADVRDGEAWIRASSQRPFGIRDEIAMLLQLPKEKVHVQVSEIGGGFGRKIGTQAPREAVLLSRSVGRPVRVVWTRQEDFKHSYYRQAACLRVKAGLREDGTLLAWDYTMASGGDRFSSTRDLVSFYPSASHRTGFALPTTGVPVGPFRALGSAINAFARESFIDELASAAGIDPLTFRLKALGDTMPRLSTVLRTVVEKSGWTPGTKPRGDGQGFGLACCLYREKTYVAQLAQVRVVEGGSVIKVERITTVLDCGFVVNPEGVKRQAEGGATMAASYTLGEAVQIDGSIMSNASFRSYPILRIGDAPSVQTFLVGQSRNPSVGAGEPVTVPVAAAIANAYFDATGLRKRTLPFSAAQSVETPGS